jgi:hypothetical protein
VNIERGFLIQKLLPSKVVLFMLFVFLRTTLLLALY